MAYLDENGLAHYHEELEGIFVKDVQVNGTSVVSDGVANVPVADDSTIGVAKFGASYGVGIGSGGQAYISQATSAQVKTGTAGFRPIAPEHQHEATFYGLAKAAGDTTQALSNNTVGTYTNEAKTAISGMLGFDAAVVTTVTVSGTDLIITAVNNTSYNCGEISTLDFTPCENGVCSVVFTSGSSATILTVPNTVLWPDWFDPDNLDTDTIYEINIRDGIYGAVIQWNA